MNNTTKPQNQFITSLKPMPATFAELERALTPAIPVPTDETRAQGPVQRMVELGDLERVFIPTSQTIAAAIRIRRLVEGGYKVRPPAARYWRDHEVEVRALKNPAAYQIGSTSTAALVGVSGSGKTSNVDLVLNTIFAPLIEFDQKVNPLLPRWQIPAVKITCPVNRTPRAFITEFFDQIEALTGVDHREGQRLNDDELLVKMGRVARIHAIGLIAFDEVQQIAAGDEKLMNLLLRITNTLHVPVLFIGTPDCLKKEDQTLANARRLTGEVWRPYAPDDPDWDNVLTQLWAYLYTKHRTKLTPALKHKFHDLIQGIPALAKALFGFAQEHVIMNPDECSGEEITPELLQAVYDEKMSSVAPAMMALRTGVGLDRCLDLLPPSLPTPESWTTAHEKTAADAQDAFYDSAIRKARRQGKQLALDAILKAS